ncbi:MAG TPA: GNAT family protein [Nocardioides sp.]|uniref:GNAT family N-acetyltransferase n=1 Tax=Nocardioides sp. TaxID=35761 RepID=UPI002F3EF60C
MTGPSTHDTPSLLRDAAATYRLRVAGHLDDHWSNWLGDVTLVHHDDATTTVTLKVADQAQLHGVLVGIRDLGAPLLGLEQAEETTGVEPILNEALRTERLILRSAAPRDACATWVYRRLGPVNEWLTGVPDTIDAYREQFIEPSRLATTVIVERSQDGQLVGDFMLRREDAWAQVEVTHRARGAQAELGWVLDPSHTGVGYATEAVRELLRFCFEDLQVHRVVANCFLANQTSWRLMERVGMRRETHAIKDSLHRSGQWLDTLNYALLREEWAG